MRLLSTAFRKSIEMRDSAALILAFVTVEHPQLSAPIRVVSEDKNGYSRSSNGLIINYNLAGNLYVGTPFWFDLVTDNDRPPVAKMQWPDVESTVTLAILAAIESPTMTLEVYESADFGSSLDGSNARSPIGSPITTHYRASNLTMRNFTADQVVQQIELRSFDYTSEPYPYHRVTKDDIPGAYW